VDCPGSVIAIDAGHAIAAQKAIIEKIVGKKLTM